MGAQGGDLNTCMKIGNNNGISLINISRSISFAGDMSPKSIKDASSNFLAQMHEAIINGDKNHILNIFKDTGALLKDILF